MNRALVTIVAAAWVTAGVCAPPSLADPTGPAPGPVVPAPGPDAAPAENQAAPAPLAVPPDPSGSTTADACKLFNEALEVAAINYEEFAYASAGDGNYVDYQDPIVGRANVIGRTALRQAAGAALSASQTPGLPPEVADPMRSWSLRATKLLLVMGLRGGGDSLNNSVAELNAIGHNGQMACALAAQR